jgi:hypothetical protein
MHDSRAPSDSLGGGQLSLHILLDDVPLGFSIAGEYYTKGPDPTQPYEIEDLVMANAFYVRPLDVGIFRNLSVGGGVGRLSVPQEESATAFQAAAILDTKLAWRISGFAEAKYVYCHSGAIEFDNFALLFGVGFRITSW